VKKWGLAPMTGSLAPPPPYGSEQGSILLESGRESAAASHSMWPDARHGRTRSGLARGQPTSPGPVRSPTDISLAHLVHVNTNEDAGEGSTSRPAQGLGITTDQGQAPPEYSSPGNSESGSPRPSGESERRPLIRPKNTPPPIPSYNDAVAERRREDRERTERSRSHSMS